MRMQHFVAGDRVSIFNPENKFYEIGPYYSIHFKSYEMNRHAHDRCEIMYIHKGKCSVFVTSDKIELKQGEFIFIDRNVPHQLHVRPEAPCRVMNLEFTCKPDGYTLDISEAKNKVPSLKAFLENPVAYRVFRDNGAVGGAMSDLLFELERNGSRRDDYLTCLLLTRLLVELSRRVDEPNGEISLGYLKKACGFLLERFDSDPSIDEVAAYVSIHKSYLQKLFKRNMGIGISEYKNRLKLQKAEYLLKNTNMDITDIAFEAGYNSRQHFGRIFHQYYKVSPKMYRQGYETVNNMK